MAAIRKVDATTYYNTLPDLAHECGDIWRDLPSFGMIGTQPCRGIIITPACDLSWQKSDTLTYLPIIPMRSYFSMDAALPIVIDKIMVALQSTQCGTIVDWKGNTYISPSSDEINSLENSVLKYKSEKQRSAKINSAIDRVVAGVGILKAINDNDLREIDSTALDTLFGAEWEKNKERIIRNNFSPALHFLPSDRQDPIFSAIERHSVVLFRYPITVPVRVLSHAQESTDVSWADTINSMNVASTLRSAFTDARPVKLASLKAAFLSDLLTRFSALYNRVGSPDFSDQTVKAFVQEVNG